jgi:hypothetical protein
VHAQCRARALHRLGTYLTFNLWPEQILANNTKTTPSHSAASDVKWMNVIMDNGHPERAFFQKIEKFWAWAWADKLG